MLTLSRELSAQFKMTQPLSLRVALVRACATEWDDQDRLTGNLDVPLSEGGREMAVEIAGQLSLYRFASIISAPCQAALQTAEILGSELGLKVRQDASLINVNLGMWQGKRVGEVKNCQPRKLRDWQETPDLIPPPNGETTDEVRGRIQKSLKRLARKFRDDQVLLVAPEPLASVIKSELLHEPIGELKKLSARCGSWEWLTPATADPRPAVEH